MKQFSYTLLYIALLSACILTSCKEDFDELQDSDLRSITFTLDASHMFDNVLLQQQGSFAIGYRPVLDKNQRLRITAYCYDNNDSLLQRNTILINELSSDISHTFRHLDKDATYHFVYLADVVEYDPDLDYLETWYQLTYHKWQDFHIASDNRHEMPQADVLYMSEATAQPSNQSIALTLSPLSYNGYYVLTNGNKFDRLSGYVGYTNSFKMSTKSWQRRTSLAYEFSYYKPDKETIIQPLNLCYADSVITMKLKATSLQGSDSVMVDIPNANRRPFVLSIDCETLTPDCKFY
ncbi:MAG: hypothetical protein J5486_06065 [Bacteroidaceae bacterium]|nr:hypothetical protein [Bacteroidaceae bacterium]